MNAKSSLDLVTVIKYWKASQPTASLANMTTASLTCSTFDQNINTVNSRHAIANGKSSSSSSADPLFTFDTVAFVYDKLNKAWCEVGEGATAFAFDKATSSIVIKRGEALNHRVSLVFLRV